MHSVLVVGCGSIGLRHTRNLVENFPYEVAVQDPRRPDALPEGVRYFENLTDALSRDRSAVIVATPTDMHVDTARMALDAGAHVFVEKPLSNQIDGLDALCDQARWSGLTSMVACNMRFHPGPAALREHVGALGKVYFTRAEGGYYLPYQRPGVDYRTVYASQRAQGGGAVMDFIHEIDYHAWLFGPIGSLTARTARLSDLEMDVEDYAAMHLVHASGVHAEIHVDYLQRCRRRTCQIAGEHGTLIWESQGKAPEVCTVRIFLEETGRWKTLVECEITDMNFMYVEELRHFFSCIETGQEPMATLDHGRQLVEAVGPIVSNGAITTDPTLSLVEA